MTATIRGVDYYYVTVKDQPGEAARFLTHLAEAKVHLLAFSAFPIGPGVVQFALFPESLEGLERTAAKHGFAVTGPQRAFLIQGEDHLGALLDIHRKLQEAAINVFASSGVTDGRGGFGYIIYLRPEDQPRASGALGV
jgi:predicted amino acid-binding ACT domain protein